MKLRNPLSLLLGLLILATTAVAQTDSRDAT